MNVIGAAFAVLYLAVYLLFSPTKVQTSVMLVGVLGLCAIIYGGISLPSSLLTSEKSSIMGAVAVACNVAMFAAPLAQASGDVPLFCVHY